MLHTTKKNAVDDMIYGLEEYAYNENVLLKNNIPDDVNNFDDLFKDGGEGRCEHFTDLGWTYALQFGEIEDYDKENGFETHLWSCINTAMKKLQKKYNTDK